MAMTPEEERAEYEREKREAQLHQFAASALSGLMSNGHNVEMACRLSWKHAVEMMRLKKEYDNGTA